MKLWYFVNNCLIIETEVLRFPDFWFNYFFYTKVIMNRQDRRDLPNMHTLEVTMNKCNRVSQQNSNIYEIYYERNHSATVH